MSEPSARRRRLADRLRRGEQVLGALLRMPNESLVELCGLVGLDFVVIDTEHGPSDQISLSHHMQAADAAGIDVLVRTGHLGEILRALDLGATGILAPHISSVDEAEALVRAASYPPSGDRGFATYTRSGSYGLVPARQHLESAAERLVVFAMIEDEAAVQAVETIVAVPGIDGIMVGPSDLACSVGVAGDTDSARIIDLITRAQDGAHAGGGRVLSIVGNTEQARRAFSSGSDAVVYNTQAAFNALFAQLAAARPAPTTAAVPGHERPVVSSADFDARRTEPLVLLPGMLADSALWEKVIARLPEDISVQVSRIDLDDSVGAMADSVLASAPARFALAGHSLGAIVALEITRRAPERVLRLVLSNGSARPASSTQIQYWADQRELTEAGHFQTVARDHARINLPGDAAHEHFRRVEHMANNVGPAGFLRQLKAQSTRPDGRIGLADIAVPTLVISGERDQVCPPELQRELVTGLSRVVHMTVAGAGHMTPIEAPDEVAGYLRSFLAAWPGTAPSGPLPTKKGR